MNLYALSDLHIDRAANWQALSDLPAYPDDWLLLVGDLSSHLGRLGEALRRLSHRFARVIWTPGNHDLWTHPREPESWRGVFKYNLMISLCRDLGILTPEDPYILWPGPGGPALIAPIFTLYDYSYRPSDIPLEAAVAWAEASDVVCNDEYLLHPDPFPSRVAWCAARCRYTEQRLHKAAQLGTPLILVSHFPLRPELARLRHIPRFSIWCGTTLTADWHTRFPVAQVVYGHTHQRGRRVIDGIPFDEVSLGYPEQWDAALGMAHYLRDVTPVAALMPA